MFPIPLLLVLCTAISQTLAQESTLEKLFQKNWADLQANWKDIGDFYQGRMTSVESLWATNRKDMTTRVEETISYLERVQSDRAKLIKAAQERSDAQTETALGKVDQMLKDVKEFQQQLLANSTGSFDETQSKWQLKSTEMFAKGLGQVVNFTSSFSLTAFSDTKANSSAKAEPMASTSTVVLTQSTVAPVAPIVTTAASRTSAVKEVRGGFLTWISSFFLIIWLSYYFT